MPADWFTLIPAGMTLIEIGKQARWHSMILQMCDGSSIPIGISPLCPTLLVFKFFSHPEPPLLKDLFFQGSQSHCGTDLRS